MMAIQLNPQQKEKLAELKGINLFVSHKCQDMKVFDKLVKLGVAKIVNSNEFGKTYRAI